MSPDKIEIVLTHVNDEYVNLEQMSKDALISFLSVVDSLKNISENLLSDEVTFSIKKGSALFAVQSTPNNIHHFYNIMNEAIDGDSLDKVVTENMRKIQKEIQNPNLIYKFIYKDVNLAPKIKNAKKITKKKILKKFDYKLEILTGFFNQIGGVDPNYHFDYGNGNRITVNCTIEDALELKDCLYGNISTLVIKKKDKTIDVKDSYYHCIILKKEQIRKYRSFLNIYNSKNDIIERLDSIYEFIYNSKNKEEDILILLKIFSNKIFDINEIKTILIISKNIKGKDNLIKTQRDKLLSLFNNLLK